MRRMLAIVLAATAMALAGTMELECELFGSVWLLKCTYQSGMLDYRCVGKWSGDTASVDTVTLESSDIVKTYFDVKKVLR